MNNKDLFESREAIQYLVEDNALALIELQTKLEMLPVLVKFIHSNLHITCDSEPAYFTDYIYKKLHQKNFLEMEMLREKLNRNFLKEKAETLWQK